MPADRPLRDPALVYAANRGAVNATVARWLVHDIRTPIQGMTLVMALVEEAGLEAIDAELRGSVVQGSRDVAAIAELFDRWMRMPPLDDEPEPVVAGDVLHGLAALVARRQARHAVRWPADTAALPAVRAVPAHLGHALLNLVLNAIEALQGRRDGEITVGADADDEWVTVSVTDNGGGMRDDTVGSGLGLPVARLLLERAGGRLDHDAAYPGPGTRMLARVAVWRQPAPAT